jgi:hypothetical protein
MWILSGRFDENLTGLSLLLVGRVILAHVLFRGFFRSRPIGVNDCDQPKLVIPTFWLSVRFVNNLPEQRNKVLRIWHLRDSCMLLLDWYGGPSNLLAWNDLVQKPCFVIYVEWAYRDISNSFPPKISNKPLYHINTFNNGDQHAGNVGRIISKAPSHNVT